jgi:hypothetical protein
MNNKENPSVREMLAEQLKAGGYNGLFDGFECVCSVDDNFMVCMDADNIPSCKAGYKVYCENDCDQDVDDHYHIQLDKPKKEDGKMSEQKANGVGVDSECTEHKWGHPLNPDVVQCLMCGEKKPEGEG